MKNQVNMTTLKETKKALIALKKWRSVNKEFRIMLLKKRSFVNYKNTQHLNKIGKAMNKQNEKFNKEIENIKKKNTNPTAEK